MTYSDFHLECRAEEAALHKRIEALEAENTDLEAQVDASDIEISKLYDELEAARVFAKLYDELDRVKRLARAVVDRANEEPIDWRRPTLAGEDYRSLSQEIDALAAGLEAEEAELVLVKRLARVVVDIHQMNSVHPCEAMDALAEALEVKT